MLSIKSELYCLVFFQLNNSLYYLLFIFYLLTQVPFPWFIFLAI